MTQQLELTFTARRTADRSQVDDDARALLGWLRQAGGRRTASEIVAAMGDEWHDRRVRAAAEACGGAVLSAPGIAGYRLAALTSVAEYYAQERPRYRSQIRAMLRRMIAMDRAVHGGNAGMRKCVNQAITH